MKDYLRNFNWFAFVCMAALMAVGVAFVYSANYSRESAKLQMLYHSQGELALFGIIAGFALAAVNYRRILAWSWLFYLGAVALLVAVLVAWNSPICSPLRVDKTTLKPNALKGARLFGVVPSLDPEPLFFKSFKLKLLITSSRF